MVVGKMPPAARQPLELEILVRNPEGESFGHIVKRKGGCYGMNAAASMRRSESYCVLLWVRSLREEFASPKRVVGVQIAPDLPVPLYWSCLLNMGRIEDAQHYWTMLVQIQSGVLLLS
jgi:hypothetical protein